MGDCKRVHCILHYFSQRENRLGSHLWSRHGKSLRVCANEIRQHAYERAKLAIFGMKIQSKGIYIRISYFCLCMVNLTHLLKHTVNILQIWWISSTQIFFRSPNVVFFWTGEGVYWHCYQTTDTCFLSQRQNCNLSLYIYQYSSIFSCLVRDNGHLESFTKSGILALRVAYHWGGVKADLFFSVCVQFFKTKFYHSIQLFSPDLKSLFLHLPKLLDFKWRKQEIHEEKNF